jgi:hypothetical protein
VVPALVSRLNDEHEGVREQARLVLQRIAEKAGAE